MLVTFYNRPIQHGTDENGLPFYKNEVYVKINRDITNTVERAVKDEDKRRFPEQWAFFANQNLDQGDDAEGLVVEMWPPALPADVLNLKGNGIFTVQDLAGRAKKDLPAHIHPLWDKARRYVSSNGEATKLLEELETARETIATQTELIAELRSAVEAAKAKKESA